MGIAWSQAFPPKPRFTASDLPGQQGKVFIVTGGYSGIGEALAQILYNAGGKVYIAGRSEQQAQEAIKRIESQAKTGVGQLEFLRIDLSDLAFVKPAAELFKGKEDRLDVLFNNAGVSLVPEGQTTAQGHELTMGTNCLGHLLLTMELLPLLRTTASKCSPGSVRVVWSSSQVVDWCPPGGLQRSDWLTPPSSASRRYEISKTGNWFLASEFAARYAKHQQVLSLTQNPGGIKTNILRNAPWFISWVLLPMISPLLYAPIYGAYTELYCGLSPDLSVEEHSGAYVLPWGRVHLSPRQDMLDALKVKEDGGTGRAAEFWDWCEEQIALFR